MRCEEIYIYSALLSRTSPNSTLQICDRWKALVTGSQRPFVTIDVFNKSPASVLHKDSPLFRAQRPVSGHTNQGHIDYPQPQNNSCPAWHCCAVRHLPTQDAGEPNLVPPSSASSFFFTNLLVWFRNIRTYPGNLWTHVPITSSCSSIICGISSIGQPILVLALFCYQLAVATL